MVGWPWLKCTFGFRAASSGQGPWEGTGPILELELPQTMKPGSQTCTDSPHLDMSHCSGEAGGRSGRGSEPQSRLDQADVGLT